MKMNLLIKILEYEEGQNHLKHLKLSIEVIRAQIIRHREHPTKRILRTLLNFINPHFANSEKDPNPIKGRHIFMMENPCQILQGWRKSWISF